MVKLDVGINVLKFWFFVCEGGFWICLSLVIGEIETAHVGMGSFDLWIFCSNLNIRFVLVELLFNMICDGG